MTTTTNKLSFLDILHKLLSIIYNKYGYSLFNYLLNRLEKYKLLNLIIIFLYSLIFNIDIILLSNYGLSLLFIFGLFIDNQDIYYETLLFLYYITFFKNYLQYNKKILSSYPNIKVFLINTLDFLQKWLLGIILGILINTLISYLKNIGGYILKMFRKNSNNTDNNNIQKNYGNNNPHPNNEDPLPTRQDRQHTKKRKRSSETFEEGDNETSKDSDNEISDNSHYEIPEEWYNLTPEERHNETPEERYNETPEEQARLKRKKQNESSKRSLQRRIMNETYEEKQARLQKKNEDYRKGYEKRKMNETPEEKEARLQKMREKSQKRKETPEGQARLQKMREKAKKRREKKNEEKFAAKHKSYQDFYSSNKNS